MNAPDGIESRMDEELMAVFEKLSPGADPVANLKASRRGLHERFKRWNAPVARRPGIAVEDQFVTVAPDGVSVRVRIYRPLYPCVLMPAVLWMHGGAFVVGEPEQDDVRCERIADRIGGTVISVAYRLAPEHPHPIPLQDCYAVLRWMAAEAKSLGIDAERIALAGSSSGATMAAGLALMARDRGEVKVAFQLLIAACMDPAHDSPSSLAGTDPRLWNRERSIAGWRAYLGEPSANRCDAYAAPGLATDLAGLPPAYVLVGDLDLLRDENISYAQALMRAKVRTELHVAPGAFHGFETMVPEAGLSRRCIERYLQALEMALVPGSEASSGETP